MIAALYVARGGCYFGLPDVDPWDEQRDARLYAGPHPVVAHPPCARWCQLAGLVAARYPHLRRGDDGGAFAAALASVRRWGGVLEHPAYSAAWPAFKLPTPCPGAWTRQFTDPGWVCEVWQSAYGHRARKATWLYYVGAAPPPLNWTLKPGETWVSWCQNHGAAPRRAQRAGSRTSPAFARMGKQERNRTPPAFRDVLLDLARRSRATEAA